MNTNKQELAAHEAKFAAARKKWTRLIESTEAAPVKTDWGKTVLGVLLENQNKYLTEAANSTSVFGAPQNYGGASSMADTYAAGDNRLVKVIVPMLRRSFPELVSTETVGVQPMTGPISLAFAMRFKYQAGALHEARSAGTITNPAANEHGYGVGTLRASTPAAVGDTDMRQNKYTVGGAGVNPAEMGYNGLDTTFTGRSNPDFAASFAGGRFQFSDQDTGVAALLGDYEATGRIPKASFSLEKKAVEAGTRRIATSWTLELEQDLKNTQGIDISTDVVGTISYELNAEIDRELHIRQLFAALKNGEYSFFNAAQADARWLGERNRALYQYLLQQGSRMAIRNRRGVANYIVATPDVCAALESLPDFKLMPVDSTVNAYQSGVAKVGTIGGGRFTVYRDTRSVTQNSAWMNPIDSNTAGGHQMTYSVGGVARDGATHSQIPEYVLLGYKGPEYYDSGILYCPYIPIMLQRVTDPVSFEYNVGLLTRYGVVDNMFGAHLYYHVVIIDTLSKTPATWAEPAHTYPITATERKTSVIEEPTP